jgi:L,D-transpeptidase YcbB
LTYARHVSGGAFDPAKLSLYHDIKPEFVDAKTALKVLAFTPFPTPYLQSLMPQHPAYEILKQELLQSALEPEQKVEFPSGKRVKIGQKDDRLPALRERLAAEGFAITEEVKEGQELVLDKYVSKALKAYQIALNIPQTGHLDQATVKSFNGVTDGKDREKIISSLERIRWLPKDLGDRHVFVNQAAYDVAVMENGARIWSSKVIVGRPNTQTNVFSDEMETVVFNPTWGMPASILINEYLGKLRRDPGYFDRIGYAVVDSKGKKVSSRSINWNSVGANSGIGVQQPAGDGNALGEIKFLFPNSHSIYMHDTPNRNLFDEQRRNFSHGCVRVQNPREFAQVLLGLDQADIANRIEKGATQNVRIEKKTKVHLAYFTAWPDETGKVRYYADPYLRDETLEKARNIVARSIFNPSTVKITDASSDTTVVD